MRTIVSILAILCAVIIAGVLSGEIVSSQHGVHGQTPETPRTRALRALDGVDRRLDQLSSHINGDAQSRGMVDDLSARSRAIRARVEKTDPDDDSQRGAWAGLRASIADLEYRTDVLVLTARSNEMGFGEAAEPLISESIAAIAELDAQLNPQGRLDHGAQLDSMRTELERLRIETADDVPSSRASEATVSEWAKRLGTLRRELRSIGRRHAGRNALRSSR